MSGDFDDPPNRKYQGQFVYKLELNPALQNLLKGQVCQCYAEDHPLTPHPLWDDHWISKARYPGRTQVQLKWNEFRPEQLQASFIRDWGQYWNRHDE